MRQIRRWFGGNYDQLEFVRKYQLNGAKLSIGGSATRIQISADGKTLTERSDGVDRVSRLRCRSVAEDAVCANLDKKVSVK